MEITYKDKIIKAQKGTKIKEVLKEEIETSKYNIMGTKVTKDGKSLRKQERIQDHTSHSWRNDMRAQ